MAVLSDEMTAYINRKTGELFTVGQEEESLIAVGDEDAAFIPAWQKEILPKVREVLESDGFVPLPGKFEMNEYAIIERFCRSLLYEDTREDLLMAIRGSGAFRRFKDAIYRSGIQEDWFSFRDQAFKSIASDFLDAEGIPHLDDVAG
jgi:hypothetical protein